MGKNQRRPFALALCLFDRLRHIVDIVSILYFPRVPAVGGEARGNIFCECQTRGPGQRNMVLVVQINQLAQSQVAGERGGLAGDALHEIAIAANCISVVIHDVVAGTVIASRKPCFHYRHTDTVSESLA
jgi:hypothetical protein